MDKLLTIFNYALYLLEKKNYSKDEKGLIEYHLENIVSSKSLIDYFYNLYHYLRLEKLKTTEEKDVLKEEVMEKFPYKYLLNECIDKGKIKEDFWQFDNVYKDSRKYPLYLINLKKLEKRDNVTKIE